jgi:molybdopterin-guanine dinucleotide biosynthesis protein MobB
MNSICIIGIAGYSGSGKTTLIRKILSALKKQGLSVGVLKHIHHKLTIDTKGKDTDFFYRAGADVISAHDELQGFMRYRSSDIFLAERIGKFPAALDLIIVEGYKEISIPGIWLEKGGRRKNVDSGGCRNRRVIFRDDPEYGQEVLAYIQQELERFHAQRPVNAGLLIGGKSTRMGAPKALLKIKGRTLVEHSVDILSTVSKKTVLLGSGQLPESLNSADRLPDIPKLKGPLAGMLSAFRWAPESAWIISSVDLPLMHKEAWEWLLSQRKPGVWAVLPKIKGSRGIETTAAVYEPMIFEHIESLAAQGIKSLQEIAKHEKVITPVIPEALSPAWSNVNTPGEWKEILCNRAEI